MHTLHSHTRCTNLRRAWAAGFSQNQKDFLQQKMHHLKKNVVDFHSLSHLENKIYLTLLWAINEAQEPKRKHCIWELMKCFTPSEKKIFCFRDMGFIAAWNPKTSDFVFIQRQKCFTFKPVCKTICFMPSSSQEKVRDDVGLLSRTSSMYVDRCPWPWPYKAFKHMGLLQFLTSPFRGRREMLIAVRASGNFAISMHTIGTLPNK